MISDYQFTSDIVWNSEDVPIAANFEVSVIIERGFASKEHFADTIKNDVEIGFDDNRSEFHLRFELWTHGNKIHCPDESSRNYQW